MTTSPEDDRLKEFQAAVKEDIRELREDFRNGMTELRTTIATLPIVRHDVYLADRRTDDERRASMQAAIDAKADKTVVEEHTRRLDAFDSFQTWLVRLFLGALGAGAIGALYTAATH